MSAEAALFLPVFIRFFFLLTPFFALTMFLTMTHDFSESQKHGLALRVTLSVSIIGSVLFFFGAGIFDVFGITVDAFRVGAGALLFLTSVSLVQGKSEKPMSPGEGHDDIAVVPLGIPIIIGPATIGTIIVMSAEVPSLGARLISLAALLAAVICVGILLFVSTFMERLLGRRGLNILTKITGLILAALASQMILTGIKNMIFLS